MTLLNIKNFSAEMHMERRMTFEDFWLLDTADDGNLQTELHNLSIRTTKMVEAEIDSACSTREICYPDGMTRIMTVEWIHLA